MQVAVRDAEGLRVGQSIEIVVPDIGDFNEVEVVEILVAEGDSVEFDDPIVSVESDKATMEIPSTAAGVVAELRVKEGDRVSEGTVLAVLDALGNAAEKEDLAEPAPAAVPPKADEEKRAAEESPVAAPPMASGITPEIVPEPARPLSPAAANPIPDRAGLPHASPLVRRYAREMGVPLDAAEASGPHGRIVVEDLREAVRARFAGEGGGTGIPAIPAVDFSAFGPVHEEDLTRIQKVSGPHLHRSWLNIPHVTHHDEADVTKLEAFRGERKAAAAERGLKLSPLLFVMKAVVTALGEFPKFRSSLSAEGDHLIVKDFFHLGIAVDTDQGLVVPVVRDVDRKSIYELAAEVSETAERARARKLGPDDLRGAVFTISSLGGIGGTAFTPIVNAPEVAILGLSKTQTKPVWRGEKPGEGAAQDEASGTMVGEAAGAFVPRQRLPLSLSYDHRIIDGAEAARFTARLTEILSDPLFLLL